MQKKIMSFMEEYHMAGEGDLILAAVSGGADSICLLLMLLEIRQEKNFELCVVHVEHGIRGEESLEDAHFVENFCQERNIPCKIFYCHAAEYAREHKMTVEEGARKLRYEFFRQAAEEFGADKIAVAHNQNDCAETMLFHLARGCGLKGLSGIPPVRGNIIRPLLCVDRKEIESYLKVQGQTYCSDKTNEELKYTRNKIRHQIMPVLEEINTQAVAHMNRLSFLAGEASDFIYEMAGKAKEKYVFQSKMGLSVSGNLIRENRVIQKTVLFLAITEMAESSRDISEIHIRQVIELFGRQTGRILKLPYGMEAWRTYDGILLKRETFSKQEKGRLEEGEVQKEILTLAPEGVLKIPSYGYEIRTRLIEKVPSCKEIPKKKYTKWLDYDKIKGVMQLRNRREKDFFIITPDGRRKKLKKYLIDEKIPGYERERILLIVDDVHIIWAIGFRISEDVKVTEQTKRILEIQVDGGRS